jgi:hypothetical protein
MKSRSSLSAEKLPLLWISVGSALGLGLALSVACSSSTPAAAACDSKACLKDNECIADEGETKCRLLCESDVSPTASCPTGYYCKAGTGTAAKNFCAKGNQVKTWGKLCNPQDADPNAACGPVAGFKCYAKNPTDAAAFCTITDCKTDADCGLSSYYCATVDRAPNIKETARSYGETVKVCLPRTECAPCKADADCSQGASGSHKCVKDDSGSSFCMKECGSNTNCTRDAVCESHDGANVCYPGNKVCKGDGKFCARCTNDDECESKICMSDDYTEERNCAAPPADAPATCYRPPAPPKDAGAGDGGDAGDTDAGDPDAAPPKTATCSDVKSPQTNGYVACLDSKYDPKFTKAQCVGFKGLNGDPNNGTFFGCYSRPK